MLPIDVSNFVISFQMTQQMAEMNFLYQNHTKARYYKLCFTQYGSHIEFET